ncbi:hypothetical protein [Acidovorax sp. ACV01]|uniref:hypothetical protein n=1 Tax=Acidovorax sp. ACV01 TaxID=2769311 RepID=UPI0017802ABD|nr:hypothetical protein [Acidovorax sp. ACV01]MBD9395277.1 hypothetical protein [Acidovorax sp. ACV01]
MIKLIKNSEGKNFWLLDGFNVNEAIECINESDVKRVSLNLTGSSALNDIDFLSLIAGVKTVSVECEKIIDVSVLNKLPDLKEIYLCKNVLADFDLGELQGVEEIGIEIGRWRLLPSTRMPKVKRLWVDFHKGADLAFLEKFPNMVDLSVLQARNLNNLSGVEFCPRLEKIILGYCQNLLDISALGALSKIRYLEMMNLMKLSSVASIFELPSLTSLIIEKLPKIDSLKKIASMPDLEIFSLIKTEVCDGDFEFFCGMPKLRHCYIKPNKSHYHPSAKYLYGHFGGSN